MGVAAIKNAVAWMLSDGVSRRQLILPRVLIGSHRTIGGSIRAILLAAEDLLLFLGDQWSARIHSPLLILLGLSDNILLLLNFCQFLRGVISYLVLNILKPLFGISPLDSAACSLQSATGIIGNCG